MAIGNCYPIWSRSTLLALVSAPATLLSFENCAARLKAGQCPNRHRYGGIASVHRMWRYCVLPAALAVLLPGAAAAQQSSTYSQGNDIPPRLQWEGNWGYCGEVSFISAGLYYGQYVSQYDARALASPGVKQKKAKSQLLIGVNDQKAAKAMHLNASEWDTASETSSASFLVWVKRNVSAGYPVVIGVFNNESGYTAKQTQRPATRTMTISCRSSPSAPITLCPAIPITPMIR